MSHLQQLHALTLEKIAIRVLDETSVGFVGSISLRAPSEVLRPFFSDIHQAAVSDGLDELIVDFTALEFMNSSSIRVLVTWLDWIAAEPEAKQYVLHFRTNAATTWQQTTLSVLQTLSREHVKISSAPNPA